MNTIINLQANTNSQHEIPAYARFNKSDLDKLIRKYSAIFEDVKYPEIVSIDIREFPECTFLDEDDCDWDVYHWEHTLTSVGKNFVLVTFTSNDTGHELFFEYDASAQ